MQEKELLNTLKVGIVGCGHLGQAIAVSLINNGLKKENLLISYRGNPDTFIRLEAKGLAPCITGNRRVFEEAGIVLIMIKPQDLPALKETFVSAKGLMVSCMAGVPCGLLKTVLGTDVCRMMFSGPDTVLSGKGVSAVYPENETADALIRVLGLRQLKPADESGIDTALVGVCMPAALLMRKNREETRAAAEEIGKRYPLFRELYDWALTVVPEFETPADTEDYIMKMVTKGGITDAIVKSLQRGETLDEALQKGVERSKAITQELQEAISDQK